MRGVITQVKSSSSGKSLGVQIDGKWYSTKEWALQGMVGKEIVGETSDSEYKGKTMTWINSYSVVGDAQTAQNPAQHAPQREDYAPTPPTEAYEPSEPAGDPISTSKSIFAQSVLKSWVDPNCSNDEMKQRVRAVVELVKGLPV